MPNTSTPSVPTGSYLVRPIVDLQYFVNANFQLEIKKDEDLQKFELFYLADKKSFVINNQFGTQCVKWNGNTGVGNLVWDTQNTSDDSMLWVIEKEDKQHFMIRNKKDPTMVWDVHNYNPGIGVNIKLEKEHPAGMTDRKAQLFVFDDPRQ